MHTVPERSLCNKILVRDSNYIIILYGDCVTVCGQRKLWCCCDNIHESLHAKTVCLV